MKIHIIIQQHAFLDNLLHVVLFLLLDPEMKQPTVKPAVKDLADIIWKMPVISESTTVG